MRQCGKSGSTSPCSISMTRSSSVLGTSMAGDSSKSPCSGHLLPQTTAILAAQAGVGPAVSTATEAAQLLACSSRSSEGSCSSHASAVEVPAGVRMRGVRTFHISCLRMTVRVATMPPIETPPITIGRPG